MKFKTREAAVAAQKSAVNAGRAIAARAEDAGRMLTATERTQIKAHLADARAAKAAAEELAGDKALIDYLSDLGRPVSGSPLSALGGGANFRGSGLTVKGRLSAAAVGGAVGRKAVVETGATLVPTPMVGDLVAQGQRPELVAELLPVAPVSGDVFRYLQHTIRTNNAATVARGAQKPTSVITVDSVDDRTRTIAHLSEPINRGDLMDSENLRSFLDAELRYGTLEELDNLVVAGDGVGENFEGLLEVSGHAVIPFDTDVWTTTRGAITAAEVAHVAPSHWLIHPVDYAALDLARSDQHFVLSDPGTAGNQLPLDRSRRVLWDVPVVTSTAVPQGTAVLFQASDVVLVVREGVRVDMSENVSDDFTKNLVRLRSEMRAALAVLRPFGIFEVSLTPGS